MKGQICRTETQVNLGCDPWLYEIGPKMGIRAFDKRRAKRALRRLGRLLCRR
jgi:hypothetical protein